MMYKMVHSRLFEHQDGAESGFRKTRTYLNTESELKNLESEITLSFEWLQKHICNC